MTFLLFRFFCDVMTTLLATLRKRIVTKETG